jgi:murein DD-endopeptidase MepM/ murein hydrolase activator NlpD
MSARRRVLESRMPDPDLDAPLPSLDRGGAGAPGSPFGGRADRAPGSATQGREALNVGFATPKPPSVAPASRWVGRTAAPDDRVLGRGSALSLTPRMTALFVGLFGLATVTTIIALLIQGSPPKDVRTAASALASASANPDGSPSAAPTDTPAPVSKKRVRVKLPGPPRVADLAKQPNVRLVEDVMGPRSFIVALGEKGVPKDQVYRILKAFDGVRKFDKTGKKDRFVVALDRSTNQVKGFEFVVSPLEVYQAMDADGVLAAQKLDLKVTEEEYVGSFYVGKNLQRSLEWGGFEPDLLRVIDEAFAGKLSHDSFEEGGVVKVIATELTSLGDFIKYKNVVAIEYQPPDPSASPVRAYTYQGASAKGYFDEKGRQPDGSGWGSPVPGAPVTSKFNPKRLHPVLKKVMPHNGTDYGAVTGTPVHAVFSGKLSFVGNAGPCGNMVAIMHANGIESGYCHLHKIAPGLKVGAKIGSRAVIGQVGSTGRSTGPHLHFWTKKDAKFFDSETLKIDGFRVVPLDERAAFSQRKLELDGRLVAIAMPDPPPAEPTRPTGPTASSASAASPTDPALEEEEGGSSPGSPGSTDKPGTAKTSAPVEVDSGDGEDLVGADLKR